MELTHVDVDDNLREKSQFSDATFPMEIWINEFCTFVDQEISCHWHDKFEYSVMLSGSVDYYIDDQCCQLSCGEGVFVNSNVLHRAVQSTGCNNAVMLTVTFSETLISSNKGSTVYRKYFEPVLRKNVQGFVVSDKHQVGKGIIDLLKTIQSLDPQKFGYELECIALLAELWKNTAAYIMEEEEDAFCVQHNYHYVERTLKMLSYIQENFSQNISIKDIAESAAIGNSECFRCFRKFTNKSPIEYVNDYRLAQAAKLLLRTQSSIADVSVTCGFTNSSYFGKQFRRKYGMSPLKYKQGQLQQIL
ncbi:Melibiose operon regulatory protein [Blautia producta]|uniref:Melibiose operon regulatory protein n=1 Tax=Blautia producta TaxID=33035 RepID=A0A4P6LXM0_9FIRM|nr:AraC family transcriptional regulator [Blautia producta]QBE97351.1 Melibiose operon regulatory protein [Blautia producta]